MTGTTRTTGQSPTKLADAFAGIDTMTGVDERERDVILRAYTFAMVVGTVASGLAALLLAAVGAGFWSVFVILAAAAGSIAATWYCARHAVNLTATTGLVKGRRAFIAYGSAAIFTLAWLALVYYHGLSGAPLLDVGISPTIDADFQEASTVAGAVVGAGVALGSFALVGWLIKRMLVRRENLDAEDED